MTNRFLLISSTPPTASKRRERLATTRVQKIARHRAIAFAVVRFLSSQPAQFIASRALHEGKEQIKNNKQATFVAAWFAFFLIARTLRSLSR
jgi:hypothetical protein